jgi:hypothetical protein
LKGVGAVVVFVIEVGPARIFFCVMCWGVPWLDYFRQPALLSTCLLELVDAMRAPAELPPIYRKGPSMPRSFWLSVVADLLRTQN